MWFRQMAQLSTTISHAHNATAFHCVELARAALVLEDDSACLLNLEPFSAVS